MKIANIEVTPIRPDRWGDDLDVVNAARVSFSKESEFLDGKDYFNTPYGWQKWDGEQFVAVEDSAIKQVLHDRDAKLIKYLAAHKHHSPFNHSFLSFRVKAPLYVAAQLHKHEYMPVNSVSRRYVDSEPEYFQTQWRWKASNVKQGSGDVVDTETQSLADGVFSELCEMSINAYNELLSLGICEEQARRALLVDAATEWIWSGTLKAFMKMLELRLDPHAQAETQEVARLIATHVQQLFPVSYEAYLGSS